MRALFLSAAAIVAVPTAASSAGFTLGGPLAVHCYEAALTRNSTPEAMQACTRSLAEEPLTAGDRAATLVNRGVLHMLNSGYVEADRNFDSALVVDPTSADAWLNKAFLRLRQGDGRAALPMLERALQLQSQREALAYYARGIAHEQVGDFGAAYADLVRAQRLDPEWDLPSRELTRYQRRGG